MYNIIHFKEPLYVEKESIGYIKETIKEEEPLNKGDMVIIDTDYLFIEKDFHEDEIDSNINLDFYKANELRYQKEKKWGIRRYNWKIKKIKKTLT